MSACVLIGMSSGTMATNSKEKVRVCVWYAYMCAHVYVCMYVFLYTGPAHCSTCMYLFVCKCVVCMYVYVCMYTNLSMCCVCVCVQACVHVCTYVCMHVCVLCMCACTRVRVLCMCACVHVRVHDTESNLHRGWFWVWEKD